jgi:hypothetical protein
MEPFDKNGNGVVTVAASAVTGVIIGVAALRQLPLPLDVLG